MMQPLDVNLASRPFRNNTLLWVGHLAAFLFLAAFTTWNVVQYRETGAELESLGEQISSLATQDRNLRERDRLAIEAIEAIDLDLLDLQAEKANEVIDWKAFSWTRFFNLMETLQPWNVRMTSIRPLFLARREGPELASQTASRAMPVAVEGVAKTFADFAELEQVLQADPHFGRVEPERIHRTDAGEVSFRLQFLYTPDAARPAEAAVGPVGGDAAPQDGPPVEQPVPEGDDDAPGPVEPPDTGDRDAAALDAPTAGDAGRES